MNIPWKYVIGVALVLLAVQQGLARAKAVGRADAEAAQVKRLTTTLNELAFDTIALSAQVTALDSERRAQYARDSVALATLRSQAEGFARELGDIRSRDSLNVANVEEAFGALFARINPEDRPALHRAVKAVEVRVSGLERQIDVQAQLLVVSAEQYALVITERDSEREGRRAADALLDGVRRQGAQLTMIVDTQAREIEALRDAVGGFGVTIDGWWLVAVGVVIGAVAVR